jgi:uncharacterized membrane protein YdbT with pleckstrin-like domain
LSNTSDAGFGSVVWSSKPWIVPAAVARTIAVVLVGFVFVWLEYASGDVLAGINIVTWTVIAFFLVWLIGLFGLLVERATNTYTLKNDSLEIRTGILT